MKLHTTIFIVELPSKCGEFNDVVPIITAIFILLVSTFLNFQWNKTLQTAKNKFWLFSNSYGENYKSVVS